jgi:microcystin degradation protein MlrC
VPVGTIAQCLDQAESAQTRPVILADSGDNPTGGGVGDRAEVLTHLLERNFDDALIAGIADEPATTACYAAGVGARLTLSVGGTLDPLGSTPVKAEADVLFLLENVPPRERQAVIQIQGVKVVLTARRRPFHDLADFERLGLDPKLVKLLVVKSGYLSPELAPIANPNLMALSDGAINQDIEGLPPNVYRRPTFPFDRTFDWTPEPVVSGRSPFSMHA